jgi:hypothetical protein
MSSPDSNLNQLLLQAQQSATQGVSAKLNIFTPFLSDADVFKGFSSQGNGIALFNPPKQLLASQGKETFVDKVFKAMREAADVASKISKENMPQGVPLQQASVSDIAGHGLSGSGPSMGGGHEV